MSPNPRRRLNHQPPPWVTSDSVYFVTACSSVRGANSLATPAIAEAILASIAHRNTLQIWFCSLAVVMPDHVHLLLQIPPNRTLGRVVSDWKHWLRNTSGVKWQRSYFDHRLRKEESLDEKGTYILQNPVRAGLVARVEDWPYTWTST